MSWLSAGPLFDMLKANERVFVQPRIVPKYPAGEDREIFLEHLCLYFFFGNLYGNSIEGQTIFLRAPPWWQIYNNEADRYSTDLR